MIPLIVTRLGAMRALGLDSNDYNFCAIIMFLQTSRKYGKNGWTEVSYSQLAFVNNIKERSAKRKFKRLEKLGLVEKNPKNFKEKRVTLKFELTANAEESKSTFEGVTESHYQKKGGDRKSPQGVTESHLKGVTESHPTLYIENNKETLEILKKKNNTNTEYNNNSETNIRKENSTPPVPPPPPKSDKLSKAKKIYEEARAKFLKGRGAQVEKFVWTAAEISNYRKLIIAFHEKKEIEFESPEFWEAFKVFLDLAATVEIWWNKTFSLYEMQIKFNSFYDELNIKSTAPKKSKHLISDEDSLEVFNSLLEEYSGENWPGNK